MTLRTIVRPLSLVAALLLLGGAGLRAQTPLSSDSLRFSITLPAGYSLQPAQVQEIPTRAGSMEMTIWQAPGDDGNSFCMLAVMDYPREMYDMIVSQGNYATATKTMLDSAVKGGLRNLNNAKVTSKKDVKLNGAIGRTVLLETKQRGKKIYGRFDFFIIENRLYQLAYLAGDKKLVVADATTGFFRSFQITPAANE